MHHLLPDHQFIFCCTTIVNINLVILWNTVTPYHYGGLLLLVHLFQGKYCFTWWNWYFNPCGEFRWSPECPVSQIHSPHFPDSSPWIFSHLLRSVQMLRREWGAESNGKLPHPFILNKTATLIPEFGMEDLPLGRTAALVPEFAVKYLSLGRTHWWWWWWRRRNLIEKLTFYLDFYDF